MEVVVQPRHQPRWTWRLPLTLARGLEEWAGWESSQGDWRHARNPSSSPLLSPPFISPDTDNQAGRERVQLGSLVPIPARITKVDSQASKLCGSAPWWGWTPLQSSAKPAPGAQVSPPPQPDLVP